MNLIPESINEPFEYLKIDKSSGQINKTSGKVINMDGMLEIIFDWMQ